MGITMPLYFKDWAGPCLNYHEIHNYHEIYI